MDLQMDPMDSSMATQSIHTGLEVSVETYLK